MLSEQPLPKRHKIEQNFALEERLKSCKSDSFSHKQLIEVLWKLRHPLESFTIPIRKEKEELIFYKTRSGRMGTANIYNKSGHQKVAIVLPNLGFNHHWYFSWKTKLFKSLMSLNYSLVFLNIPQEVSSSVELLEEDLSALYKALKDANFVYPSLLMGAGYGALLSMEWIRMGAKAEFLILIDCPNSPKELFSDHDVPKRLSLHPLEELRFYFNSMEEQRRTLRYLGWVGLSKNYIKRLAPSFKRNKFEFDASPNKLDQGTLCISNRPLKLHAGRTHIINAKHPHLYEHKEFTTKLSSIIQTTGQNWVNQV